MIKINKIFCGAVALITGTALALGFGGCDKDKKPEQDNIPSPSVKALTGISLAYGTENSYVVGETVDLKDNGLLLKYNNGETEVISLTAEGVEVSGFDGTTAGEYTGKVTYSGFTTEFKYSICETLENPVNVEGGQVLGYITNDSAVEVYKGIPYAAPPVGNLRWRAPQDVNEWEGVLDCFHYGASCIQNMPYAGDFSISSFSGVSEDCLTLNVWTDGTQNADKPVIVYLHGSDNKSGGSSAPLYDGEAMAENGVVFVSINYRLGLYGFLATPELAEEDDGCGNFALLDQIKALEWVRDNISLFGGSSSNVTVIGQGMGGMDVEALMCSPLANGLFQNAVILSSGMYFLQDLPTMEEAYYDVGELTTEQLRAMTTEELAAYENKGICSPVNDGKVLPCTSISEGLINNTGNSADVNVIVGVISADANTFADLRPTPSATGPKANSDLTLAQRNMFINARLLAGGSGKNYLYFFDYNATVLMRDIPYWLGNESVYTAWSETNSEVAATVSSYVVNFANNGDPNGLNLSTKEELVEWKASAGDYSYLYIQGYTYEFLTMMGPAVADFESSYSEFDRLFPNS